jgi:hypothetical protein
MDGFSTTERYHSLMLHDTDSYVFDDVDPDYDPFRDYDYDDYADIACWHDVDKGALCWDCVDDFVDDYFVSQEELCPHDYRVKTELCWDCAENDDEDDEVAIDLQTPVDDETPAELLLPRLSPDRARAQRRWQTDYRRQNHATGHGRSWALSPMHDPWELSPNHMAKLRRTADRRAINAELANMATDADDNRYYEHSWLDSVFGPNSG